ncbi:SDR family NAD(P)-dependent oxidoreductase [Flavobacterium sp.]|uniref:SDR family NAD(P)-dependent oxidoreductase n=1 Tax=Flavobacterium sp. TaxID=239 RepID=UPI00374CE50A
MKTVSITGANRSIGLETAKQLSKKGLFVYLGTRDLQKGETVVKELNENGYENIKAIQIDVTNLDSIVAAKNTIESEQGKLDILINNAGISGGFPQSAIDTDITIFKEVYDINVFGLIQVTQIFMDLLKKSAQPRITNLTSGLGSLTLHNDPTWQYYDIKAAIYNSSKAALNMYTITLAYELRETNFKVNVIDPGFTATDFNHHTGTGTVENAASFVIKHTVTDDKAPTGKYFSNDIKDGTEISPW